MTTETGLATIATIEIQDVPDRATVAHRLKAVADFQQVVRTSLTEGHDYGVIPGTSKPTLLKPGAEKIAKLMRLADTYEFVDKVESWDKPFFSYTIRCSLLAMLTGEIYSQGLGNCNSYEDKYRWRDAKPTCPACGAEAVMRSRYDDHGWYCFAKLGGCGAKFAADAPEIISQKFGRVENPNPANLVNTFIKMAKKRALVDAALSAGRLSDLFTQDLDDIKGLPEAGPPTAAPVPIAAEQAVSETSSQPQDDGHGLCAEHGIAFFQSSKMRSPAHRLPDGGWCNKSTTTTPPKPPATAPTRPTEPNANTPAPQHRPIGARAPGAPPASFIEQAIKHYGESARDILDTLGVQNALEIRTKYPTADAARAVLDQRYGAPKTPEQNGEGTLEERGA